MYFFFLLFFSSLFSSAALYALWPSSCLAHFSPSILYILLILLCAFLNPPQEPSFGLKLHNYMVCFEKNVFLLIASIPFSQVHFGIVILI